MMSHPRSQDEAFVAELLESARSRIADPRVRISHVHHPEALPAESSTDAMAGEVAASSLAAKAWRDVGSLAAELAALWRHCRLSETLPNEVAVSFAKSNGGVVPVVTATGSTSDAAEEFAAVGDRLLVKGWIPDDDNARAELRAQNGERSLHLVHSAVGTISIRIVGEQFMFEESVDEVLGQLAHLPRAISLSDNG
ncbi:hypothetical protein V1Y59_18425 [Gordonia sp. PKS22-38]|uniref:LUD domain-containing protein n=1 Tax=Gordonia prachuapensis TaxID=3115651 RepID=A0ABU7MXL1_9ACTN|nr:hypothetical protein [Gordonia sp. PKS22-38]